MDFFNSPAQIEVEYFSLLILLGNIFMIVPELGLNIITIDRCSKYWNGMFFLRSLGGSFYRESRYGTKLNFSIGIFCRISLFKTHV